MRQQGFYSLIQYCPDVARSEHINVGIILFCEDSQFVNSKFIAAKDLPRVRACFPSSEMDVSQLGTLFGWMKEKVRHVMKWPITRTAIDAFIANECGMFHYKHLRSVAVNEAPQQALDKLFAELVSVETTA